MASKTPAMASKTPAMAPKTPATLPLLLLAAALLVAVPVSASAQISVVVFGDSITKGYVPRSDANLPYTLTLERLLRNRFGAAARVDNRNSGASALLPAKGKAPMAPTIYSALSSGGKYRWALFMVGTNDILMGNRKSGEVIAALRPLVDAALATGSNVMLLSMPPTAISTREQERERQALNAAEKALAREYRSRGKPVTALDLEDGVFARLEGGFKPGAREVLEDGVHLCRSCYQLVGAAAFQAIGAVDGWCGGGTRKAATVLTVSEVAKLSC